MEVAYQYFRSWFIESLKPVRDSESINTSMLNLLKRTIRQAENVTSIHYNLNLYGVFRKSITEMHN